MTQEASDTPPVPRPPICFPERTLASVTVYDAARRWVASTGLPIPGPLDNHQVWSVVEQRYPGGWTEFQAAHQQTGD